MQANNFGRDRSTFVALDDMIHFPVDVWILGPSTIIKFERVAAKVTMAAGFIEDCLQIALNQAIASKLQPVARKITEVLSERCHLVACCFYMPQWRSLERRCAELDAIEDEFRCRFPGRPAGSPLAAMHPAAALLKPTSARSLFRLSIAGQYPRRLSHTGVEKCKRNLHGGHLPLTKLGGPYSGLHGVLIFEERKQFPTSDPWARPFGRVANCIREERYKAIAI